MKKRERKNDMSRERKSGKKRIRRSERKQPRTMRRRLRQSSSNDNNNNNEMGVVLELEEEYAEIEEMMMIKKGPWKAEEDEVLLCHVNRYGPRDWSSIRSKGLLQRTGKSCRLRWVNKLRPNLKNGVKFSAEEERIVIELQGQFGNRWARIATYLPGRTDNDVKNFWSSRQKRLARLLQTPSKSQHQNNNNKNEVALLSLDDHNGLPLQIKAPKLSISAEESSSSSSNSQSCSSSTSKMITMLPLPDHVTNPKPLYCEQNLLQLEYNQIEKNPTHDSELQLIPFPPIPDHLPDFPPKDVFEIPNLFDDFGKVEPLGCADIEFPFMPSFFGFEGHCGNGFRRGNDSPDIIFDELPLDMFDQIEPIQSPP